MRMINDDNVTVSEIKLCCKVSNETGISVHKKRPSHGIVLYLKGESTFVFDGKTNVNVKQGQVIYLPKDSDYTSNDSEDAVCIAINFMVLEEGNIFPMILLSQRYCEKYLTKFNKLLNLWEVGSTAYRSGCLSILYDIIFNMQKDIKSDYISLSQAQIVESAMLFINANIRDEFLTVHQVADEVGISAQYLRTLFKSLKNMSPKEYILLKRMEMAKDFLESGDIKLNCIPYECGFTDYPYFSKSFKKYFGISPKSYLIQMNAKCEKE